MIALSKMRKGDDKESSRGCRKYDVGKYLEVNGQKRTGATEIRVSDIFYSGLIKSSNSTDRNLWQDE